MRNREPIILDSFFPRSSASCPRTRPAKSRPRWSACSARTTPRSGRGWPSTALQAQQQRKQYAPHFAGCRSHSCSVYHSFMVEYFRRIIPILRIIRVFQISNSRSWIFDFLLVVKGYYVFSSCKFSSTFGTVW